MCSPCFAQKADLNTLELGISCFRWLTLMPSGRYHCLRGTDSCLHIGSSMVMFYSDGFFDNRIICYLRHSIHNTSTMQVPYPFWFGWCTHAICTLLELVSQSQFWWYQMYQVGDPFDPHRKCNCGRLARDQRREGVGSPQEAGSARTRDLRDCDFVMFCDLCTKFQVSLDFDLSSVPKGRLSLTHWPKGLIFDHLILSFKFQCVKLSRRVSAGCSLTQPSFCEKVAGNNSTQKTWCLEIWCRWGGGFYMISCQTFHWSRARWRLGTKFLQICVWWHFSPLSSGWSRILTDQISAGERFSLSTRGDGKGNYDHTYLS